MTQTQFEKISKLSELMEVAVSDGRKILDDERYRPDARYYHELVGTGTDSRICQVCLAGAVMAMSLGCRPDRSIWPADLSPETTVRLDAINYVREGNLGLACESMGIDPSGKVGDEELPPRFQHADFATAEGFEGFLGTVPTTIQWLKDRGL